MAFAPVFANCFRVACASRAEALAAFWRPAARAAASRPSASCCGDVLRAEAFLLIVMCPLLVFSCAAASPSTLAGSRLEEGEQVRVDLILEGGGEERR